MRICERRLGLEHWTSRAETFHDLGVVYESQEHYDEAIQWLTRSLMIRRKRLRPDYKWTVETRRNLKAAQQGQSAFR